MKVQPQDATLGLPPGEKDWHGGGRHYGVAAIDQLRTALRGAENRPLAPCALVRAREIVAAWDRDQAADILALARSGLTIWRRIAAEAGYDPMSLGQMTSQSPTFLSGFSCSIPERFPGYGLLNAQTVEVADAHLV
jgi:hypothetical protein